jgi:tetratricopeptide (TPR) repeat protein
MLVSSAGFPWRLAGTGALLALGLGLLAASELRSGRLRIRSMPCTPRLARGLVAATALCLACASYVSWQAALCEQKIVRAVSLGLAISASGDALNPKWNADKANMLELMREGIAINPHYRKLTPLLADELADWGDWKNAIWIWESVLASRPHVTAILSNLARAHLHLNQLAQAQGYWERARRLQPQARAVRTLEVILLYRGGQEEQALQRIRPLLQDDRPDLDVLSIAYEFGRKHQDPELAIQALTLRRQHWPEYAVDSSLKLGHLYAQLGKPAEALAAYRTALAATPEVLKEAVRQRIPAALRDAL